MHQNSPAAFLFWSYVSIFQYIYFFFFLQYNLKMARDDIMIMGENFFPELEESVGDLSVGRSRDLMG